MSTSGRETRDARRGEWPAGPRSGPEQHRDGHDARAAEEAHDRRPLDRTTYLARSHRLDAHVGT